MDAILNDYKEHYGGDFDKRENLRELAERLKYPGSEYMQYCFCTPKGVEQLILDI